MSDTDRTTGISWAQVEQVDAKRYRYEDPCVICGRKFNSNDCPHLFDEVQRLITRIKNLIEPERVAIYRRDHGMKSKTELEAQAAELVAKAEEMLEAAKQLRQEASTRYVYPAEPTFQYGVITVRFRNSSTSYKYLLFMPRRGGPIFTTGQDERTTKFNNWNEFVDWIRSDDVTYNTTLDQLVMTSYSVTLP